MSMVACWPPSRFGSSPPTVFLPFQGPRRALTPGGSHADACASVFGAFFYIFPPVHRRLLPSCKRSAMRHAAHPAQRRDLSNIPRNAEVRRAQTFLPERPSLRDGRHQASILFFFKVLLLIIVRSPSSLSKRRLERS